MCREKLWLSGQMGCNRNVLKYSKLVEKVCLTAQGGSELSRQQMGRILQHVSVKSQCTFWWHVLRLLCGAGSSDYSIALKWLEVLFICGQVTPKLEFGEQDRITRLTFCRKNIKCRYRAQNLVMVKHVYVHSLHKWKYCKSYREEELLWANQRRNDWE